MNTVLPIASATGALIAGGRGARLGGYPKGLLRLSGVPIALRTAHLFGSLFDDSMLVTNDPAPYQHIPIRKIADVISGKGAPSGLHAALQASRTEWIFAAACDLPLLDAAGIRFLAERRDGCDAVIVEWDGRLQVLAAFWSRRCLPKLEAMLFDGSPSLVDLAGAVSRRIVPATDWLARDPKGRFFENANVPADLARLGLARE